LAARGTAGRKNGSRFSSVLTPMVEAWRDADAQTKSPLGVPPVKMRGFSRGFATKKGGLGIILIKKCGLSVFEFAKKQR